MISRNIERLEARLEVHLQHADERAASVKAKNAWDKSPEGERLARYELATCRRAERLLAAFVKLTANRAAGGEDEGGGEIVTDLDAESGVAAEAPSVPEANLTNEPKPDSDAPKDGSLEEVAAHSGTLDQAIIELRRLRDVGIAGFVAPAAGGGRVPAVVEQAIFGGGPLLRPIT